ncbi:hypothetical protein ASZ97_07375 [Brucella melitensis]|nr:hypothetical protein NL70_04815 [Brucella abortus 104M]AOG37623.1 hypothetical protein BFS09_04575 [Brucella canis]AOG52729.1 hypothetical protein BFS11_04725 [Brucella melitensis]EEH14515.1 Hypothetical protein, conserved [Brucella ceti str. Cudo]EEP64461.1 Hypothetical protein, conserved [Brucella abortus str. 2308 A]
MVVSADFRKLVFYHKAAATSQSLKDMHRSLFPLSLNLLDRTVPPRDLKLYQQKCEALMRCGYDVMVACQLPKLTTIQCFQ